MKPFLVIITVLFAFCSFCAKPTVTDADGNVYRTVKIGNQVWTAENLRTTKWSDGSPIPQVSDTIAWHSLDSPGFCFYRNTNNADTIRKFGALYNWYCVDSKKLAPPGWHVPSNDDWTELQNYLIEHGYNWDRKNTGNNIAKSLAAASGWKPFNIEGTPGNNIQDNNKSGFSGIAAGYRFDSRDSVAAEPGLLWRGAFMGIKHKAGWWSATQVNESNAYVFGLGYCIEGLVQYEMFSKTCGYSVRLVKDGK